MTPHSCSGKTGLMDFDGENALAKKLLKRQLEPDFDVSEMGGSEKGSGKANQQGKNTGQQGKQGQAGGKGTRKGGGKGKGKERDRQYGQDYQRGRRFEEEQDEMEVLCLHTKVLLRIEQERREKQRNETWIVGIPVESREVVELLQRGAETWKVLRENAGGKIPEDGEIFCFLWRLFARHIYDDLKKIETISAEQKGKVNAVRKVLETSVSKKDEPQTMPASFVKKWGPLGRKSKPPPKEGRWYWMLEFRMDLYRGRESHELLHAAAPLFLELCNLEVRKDRGQKDQLVRQLEQHAQSSGSREW